MSFDLERLFDLLPAVHRTRDARLGEQSLTEKDAERLCELKEALEQALQDPASVQASEKGRQLDGLQWGPLKALLSLIAEQVAVLEEDLEQLYDDQFIETCAEWVAPYMGDLVGSSDLFIFPDAPFSRRADVANTLAYRRRKGTAAVLEQLGRDVTGWNSRVVEYFRLLATTQYVNHRRLDNHSWANVRPSKLLERLNGPFDYLAHAVDVRRIESGRGRHNIPNVGVFLWRLNSYSVTKYPAWQDPDNARRYRFDALGRDLPLHVRPQTEDEITHLAEMVNVPMRISRYMLDLNPEDYYGGEESKQVRSLVIYADGKEIGLTLPASPPGEEGTRRIVSANLGNVKNGSGAWAHMPRDKIAIDPELGRIAFPSDEPAPQQVYGTYHYGFSADLGGGEYPRTGLSVPTTSVPSDHPQLVQKIDNADSEAIIQITTNAMIEGDLDIALSPGQRLTLQAEDGKRPILNGSIRFVSAEDAQVTIDGLWITGGIGVAGNGRMDLTLRHCTLCPGGAPAFGPLSPPEQTFPDSLCWYDPGSSGTLALAKVISGPVKLSPDLSVDVTDSIIDAGRNDQVALGGPGTDGETAGKARIIRATVVGTVSVREIALGENSLFTGRVTSERKQQGCVRFCYLPPTSSVPRPYRCQPQRAVRDAIDEARRQEQVPRLSPQREDRIAELVRTRVKPCFTCRTYGKPEYMQLHDSCPVEIRAGGDDEAEMGVFHDLYQPQRQRNLRIRLNEYLRFGLEAGIIHAP